MRLLIEVLKEGNHSLVVENHRLFETFDSHGVKDLYNLLVNHPDQLENARVADKVVGKGAAVLMVLGKVKTVYALTISVAALELLKANDIDVIYETLVDNIINRQGTDICPVEKLCGTVNSPEEALNLITDFLNKTSN